MDGGSYKEPAFTVSWPTGEFGGMGLEGSVKLGYRNELAAIEDPADGPLLGLPLNRNPARWTWRCS